MKLTEGVDSIFVMLWSTRLGGFLFYRVLKTGKDGRFDEMRSKFFSFGAFWTFQLCESHTTRLFDVADDKL